MRASSGVYYEKLDHIRALAAFLVFTWHFVHRNNVIPTYFVPAFGPLSIFEEGHTGVALFMTLSGYLFAKLIDRKEIDYVAFLWNRLIRLGPLLMLVLLVAYAIRIKNGLPPVDALTQFLSGFVTPDWPNGGWSIAVELHFYLILPFLLKHIRRNAYVALYFVVAVIAARYVLYAYLGQIQNLAYSTIVGRIDQFALGIFAFYAGRQREANTPVFLLSATVFVMFIYAFNYHGGAYDGVSSPSPDPIYIIFPVVEGAFYSGLIWYYDNVRWAAPKSVSRALSFVGKISYSIYLLHFFVVFRLSEAFVRHVDPQPSYGVMLLASLIAFILTLPIAWISYRYVENAFMRFRTRYTRDADPAPQTFAASVQRNA